MQQNRRPEPNTLALIQSVDLSLFKPQYSEMDLERDDEWGFHADSWDVDGDQYQTNKEGWIYNEQGLVLCPYI